MTPKPGKLNIIWFQDEQPARRLRLRPGWVRAATYLIVLAVLGTAGGVFGAYQFWQRSLEAHSERREVEKRLSEALVKLERLQNIEKILQTSDPTELTLLLAGMGLELQPTRTQAKGKDDKPAAKDKATPASAVPAAAEKPAGFDMAEIMGRLDVGQVSVENFRARTDGKSVLYSFDLSNQQAQALSGNGQLLAVTREGTLAPVSTGKDDLGFNIQRFKQVQSQASLPKGVDAANLFGFRLVLSNASGKLIFSDTYQLEKAQ